MNHSPSTLGFYPEEYFPDYEAAGTLPDDLIEVTAEERAAVLSGMVLTVAEDGSKMISAPPPQVPQPVIVITALQGQLYIEQQGWSDEFTAFVGTLIGPQRIVANSMMYAQAEWRIDNPLILGFLMQVKGKTTEQVQDIFTAAAEIDPWAA